jgi:hypothetical protein
LGFLQYSAGCDRGQEAVAWSRPFRCRRCLLKGCERNYRPTHPQSRYCSTACRQAARRWRRWQASRRWRSSTPGKARRREQSRRYRQRLPLRVVPELELELELEPEPATDVPASLEEREGQRPATIPEGFFAQPCQRPGCYTVFAVRPHSNWQRFCCAWCRRALQRVLDREARYRRRRRAGVRRGRQRPRAPPRPTRGCRHPL